MDFLTAEAAQLALHAASKWKRDNFERVGKAKLVIAMFSDRRKQLLAKYTPEKVSNAEGQTKARQNPAYLKELEGPEGLVAQAEAAYITVEEAEAWDTRLEAARSYLAYNRESLRQLEG